jgi:hypothetical protein
VIARRPYARGTELFWTVTGDVVNAMCLADVTGDGRNELLVGRGLHSSTSQLTLSRV